jgi:hypothetical protein
MIHPLNSVDRDTSRKVPVELFTADGRGAISNWESACGIGQIRNPDRKSARQNWRKAAPSRHEGRRR